jgi:hypothetical protein
MGIKTVMYGAVLLISLTSYGQKNSQQIDVSVNKETTVNRYAGPDVPNELITGDGIYWTITTDTIAPVSASPGVTLNAPKPVSDMIVKFKFEPGNRFEFISNMPAGANGSEEETSTKVEGRVVFSVDDKGQQVFTTQAEKGQYLVIKDGVTTSTEIPAEELSNRHSNTYLWGKTTSTADPKSAYLLLIDLDAHPSVDISKPITIHPDWVSKFHTRRNGS